MFNLTKRYLFVSNTRRLARPYSDPSVRYRCYNHSYVLRSHGISATVMALDNFSESQIGNYDIFVFHRPNCAKKNFTRILDLIKKAGKVAYADYDDLIFDPNYVSELPDVRMGRKRAEDLMPYITTNWRTLAMFDNVTVSTDALARRVKQAFPDKKPIVIYNGLLVRHPDRIAALSAERGGRIITYCPGTRSHDADFKRIEDKLISFLDGHDVCLKIIGQLSVSERLRSHRKTTCGLRQLDYADYLRQISRSYANIAPLEPTVFNECKSGIKFMESGAFGVPTLSMNCDDFKRFSHPGSIVCDDESDMVERLEKLLDRDRYRQITEGLGEYCLDNCAAERQAEKLLKL